MKYFLNFEDFDEFKSVFKNKVDEIESEICTIYKACQEVEWVGLGYETTVQAIYDQIDKLSIIIECLNMFLE